MKVCQYFDAVNNLDLKAVLDIAISNPSYLSYCGNNFITVFPLFLDEDDEIYIKALELSISIPLFDEQVISFIYDAAESGNIDRFKQIYAQFVKSSFSSVSLNSRILIHAIKSANINLVREIIKLGADPNACFDFPVINIAEEYGMEDIVNYLEECGADIDDTIIHSCQTVQRLLKYENEFIKISEDNRSHITGMTALHTAVKHLNKDVCEFLLSRGFSPNTPDYKGITPFMDSVINTGIFNLLLSAGGELTERFIPYSIEKNASIGVYDILIDKFGISKFVIDHNISHESLEFLLNEGAKMGQLKEGFFDQESYDIIKKLRPEYKFDFSRIGSIHSAEDFIKETGFVPDDVPMSPEVWLWLVESGQIKPKPFTSKSIADAMNMGFTRYYYNKNRYFKGVQISFNKNWIPKDPYTNNTFYDSLYFTCDNSVDSETGMSTIMALARNGCTFEATNLLIRLGCYDEKDKDGLSVAHHAAAGGSVPVLDLFYRMYGKFELTKNGDNPLHFAAFAARYDAIRYLMDTGADLNNENNDEETPLFAAVRSGDAKAVEMIAQGKYDFQKRNKNGETILDIAIDEGFNDVYELLSKNL